MQLAAGRLFDQICKVPTLRALAIWLCLNRHSQAWIGHYLPRQIQAGLYLGNPNAAYGEMNVLGALPLPTQKTDSVRAPATKPVNAFVTFVLSCYIAFET